MPVEEGGAMELREEIRKKEDEYFGLFKERQKFAQKSQFLPIRTQLQEIKQLWSSIARKS